MSALFDYKKQFDSHYEFDDSELEVLKLNWPNIRFFNLPQAWIILIDDMLRTINVNCVSEIRQDYGYISIFYSNVSDIDIVKIKAVEADILLMNEFI